MICNIHIYFYIYSVLHTYIHIYMYTFDSRKNYWSLWQNIVPLIGLFCKRDLEFYIYIYTCIRVIRDAYIFVNVYNITNKAL